MKKTCKNELEIPKDGRIYVAGHRGLVGSAIVRALRRSGYKNLLLFTRAELDLLDQTAVRHFFKEEGPEYIFMAAAKVGGIWANKTFPAEFIFENLTIETNVIHEAWKAKTKRLLFLGSSCIYPRECPQPIKEEYLLSGPMEPTNEHYAISKIAGIKLCDSYYSQYGVDFRSVMPANLYGPHDNFDLENSHVIPALIRKFHEANISNEPAVEAWGTGKPRREFLHVDDMAKACLYVMSLDCKTYAALVSTGISHINIGTGEDVTIAELAELLKKVTGFKGEVVFNSEKPDGMPRKLLDISRIRALGWHHEISMEEGLADTYRWYALEKVT